MLTSQDLEVFDEDQRKVVLNLQEGMQKMASDAVDKAVHDVREEFGKDTTLDGLIPMSDKSKFLAQDTARARKVAQIFRSNGKIPGSDVRVTYDQLVQMDRDYADKLRKVEFKDFSSTDHPLLIPRAISEVVKEAIEPNIVLTGLLQRINYSHGTHLTFPAMGTMTAADIPEGGEYPERGLEMAGQVVATIGKSGIAVKMTDEMIRYSLYDVMALHLRHAGRALIRWKEKKASDLIIDNAGGSNTLFDNTTTGKPSTTGRDAAGAYNGTLTLYDLHKAYATMVARGYTPNTLIMNPFAWEIFADESLQRAFGFENGAALWSAHQGSPGNAPQWSNGGFGNGLLQNPTVSAPQNLATTFTNVPTMFPYPFRIVVTPYMPYNSSNNTTDLILCDDSELGVLVVDEEVMVDQWVDPARDIHKVKLRERYGLGSMNQGKGSGLIKGVSLARSFDFAQKLEPAAVTLTNLLSGDAAHSSIVGQ